MKKALLVLVALMMVVALAACAPAGEDDAVAPEITATAAAGDVGTAASDLLNAAIEAEDLDYVFENGMYDNIAGFANDDANAWFFYVNDALATVGAADYTVAEGDVLVLRYEAINNNIEDDNVEGEDANVEGEDANVEGEDANAEGEDANVEGEDANVEGEDANVEGEETPAE